MLCITVCAPLQQLTSEYLSQRLFSNKPLQAALLQHAVVPMFRMDVLSVLITFGAPIVFESTLVRAPPVRMGIGVGVWLAAAWSCG